ncbi:hypothetical protein ACIBF5_24525 [Micromonospora sp. NPDC050417]|uniref:hypothetical protein n=1 Tax=Micromonospora sp. NPDC050417 TaxID=3364280 RepID=UPI00378E3052
MSKLKIFVAVFAISSLVVLGTTACRGSDGGGGDNGVSSAERDHEQRLKWAQCMREHGIDVSDSGSNGAAGPGNGQAQAQPGPSGGSGHLGDSQPQADALAACRTFLPNGGEAPKLSEAEVEQQRRFTQCMREHGIDLPDPGADGSGISFGFVPGAPPAGPENSGEEGATDTAARECAAKAQEATK